MEEQILNEFKGNSYSGLHFWIRTNKPKPKFCEECNKDPPKDVTNISGKYLKDIRDYKWLCRKCHMESDGRIDNNLIKFKKGESPWNKGTIGVMKPNTTSFKKGVASWNKGTHLSGMKGKRHSNKTKKLMSVTKLKRESDEILKRLEKFTGTTLYYKASNLYNLKLTDGIQYLRDKLNCYWLIDIIGSVQELKKVKDNKEFIVWRILVNSDKSFIVEGYKDSPFTKENLLYKQEGEFTDFKLDDFEFYQCGEVLLLKSEY